MVVTTVAAGVFMSLVHILSKFMPNEEYAAFGALLQLLGWIGIPTIGLQATFAQQTSAVRTTGQRHQLVGAFHFMLRGTFCLWLMLLLAAFLFQRQLLDALKIPHPAALWLMMVVGLFTLWLPTTQGLLQGRQNFRWLGWAILANSLGRLLMATAAVLLVSRSAAGIMAGALLGTATAFVVGLWQNRDLLAEPRAPIDLQYWLRQVVPLSLASGATVFLFSADLLFVQAYLEDTAPYVFGGTLARGIVLVTAPLVSVMFPKIAHSVARNRPTDLLLLTLALTVMMASAAALFLSLFSGVLIRLGSKAEYLSFVPLMPLFAWSMMPMAVANVLLNSLLARADYRCVPALLTVAAGYWVALQFYHDSFKSVLLVLATFNVLLLCVSAFYTWIARNHTSPLALNGKGTANY